MKRSFRKLTRNDFSARVSVVERTYQKRVPYHRRRDRSGERPVFWLLCSFGWTYVAVFIALNRRIVELTVADNLPREHHAAAMAGVAAVLTISMILLGYHVLRGVFRAPRYYNSGAILAGFAAAIALHCLPFNAVGSAYALLDKDVRIALENTVQKVSPIDLSAVRTVSSDSRGKLLAFE